MRYAAIGLGRPIRNASDSSLRTSRPAPVAGERTAPTPRHVLHTETGPRFVEAGRIERPAVPVEHRPVLLERRIEDRLQKNHEVVRPADTLRRTTPGPTHEDRTFHVRIAAATSMPSIRQKRRPRAAKVTQTGGIPRFLSQSAETESAHVFVPKAGEFNLTTLIDLFWAYTHQAAGQPCPAQRRDQGIRRRLDLRPASRARTENRRSDRSADVRRTRCAEHCPLRQISPISQIGYPTEDHRRLGRLRPSPDRPKQGWRASQPQRSARPACRSTTKRRYFSRWLKLAFSRKFPCIISPKMLFSPHGETARNRETGGEHGGGRGPRPA